MKRLLTLFLSLALLLTMVPFGALRVRAASNFQISDAAVEIIKKWEGFSAKPYWDYQQWTIGYGTRVPDGKLSEYTANGISQQEATVLLKQMLNTMGQDVNTMIDKFGLEMTQSQFDALVSLTFNCGSAWTTKVSELRTAVIEGYTGNDFIFALAQWSTAGGTTLPALVRRRLSEANMYLNNEYDSVPPANYCYVRFDANGGKTEIITQGYDSSTPATIRAVPTYEGYQFAGWYTSATGGEKVELLDEGVRNYTLYAHWSAGEGEDMPQDNAQSITGTPVNYQVEIATGVLSSFENPVKGALVVDGYPLGEIVDIVAEYTDANGRKWGKISGNGGWINLEYTQEPIEEDESNGIEVEVTGSDVNLRRGPGTGYAMVGKAYKGNKLIITRTQTGGGYTWGKSSKGWIALKYTNYDAVVNGEAPGEEETPDEPQQPQEPLFTGTVKVQDGLTLRSGPGTNHTALGYLSNGTKVEILEKKTAGGIEWGRIEKGWICLNYVQQDTQDETPEEPPVQQPANPTGTVSISAGTLNVRSGPSTGYSVVAHLAKGAKVEILEQKTVGATVWGRTEKGWISMDYVKLDPVENEPVIPPVTEPDEPPVSEPPETAPSKPPVTEPEEEEPDVVPPAQKVTGKIVLSSETLNIRAGAGTAYAVVGYLRSGDSVEILEQKTVGATVWGRIDKGWISMDYVRLDSNNADETTKVSGTVAGTGGTLRIRKGPGTTYAIAGFLAEGTRVEILERRTIGSTVWGRIDKGWISLDYVQLDGAEPDPDPEPITRTGTITADCLRIRAGAGTGYATVGLLYNGAQVTILETKIVGGVTWGRIDKGWISMDYVK